MGAGLREPDAALPPGCPVIDAHHHLWRDGSQKFEVADFLTASRDVPDLTATIFVECRTAYRAEGPVSLRSVGETEFAAAAADQAGRNVGAPLLCEGIVAYADFRLGSRIGPVIEAHRKASGGRLSGFRFATAYDPDPRVRSYVGVPGLLVSADVVAAAETLSAEQLVLDTWVFHHQIPEVAALADAVPGLTIVLDHMAAPLSIAPYDTSWDAALRDWRRDMAELARRPNVRVKLGGLGMKMTSQGAHNRSPRLTHEELAGLWRPLMEPSIELFGPERAMFESNAPMDFATLSYAGIWAVFSELCRGASREERARLFAGTAQAVYLTNK